MFAFRTSYYSEHQQSADDVISLAAASWSDNPLRITITPISPDHEPNMSSTKTSELPPVPQTQASPAHPILADQSAPAPPSAVADYDYPNVPEMTEPQQGGSSLGPLSIKIVYWW